MSRTLLLTLIVLVIEVLIVGIIMPSDWLHKSILHERDMVRDWLGDKATIELVDRTNEIYMDTFAKTGIVMGSYEFIPTEEERAKSRGFERLGENDFFPFAKKRIDVMWSAIYQSIQRLSLLLLWAPYMLPLFIPALIDGMSTRSIKKVTYGYASPVRYHTAFHAIVLLSASVPFYLALPFAVTPIIVPVWAAAMSAAVMLMMTNLQKQI